jgi:hypothetical protein
VSTATPTAPAIPPDTDQALFFFGTLLEPRVLALVTGLAIGAEDLIPARLAGFRRVRVQGKSYPTLVEDPLTEVVGAIWRGRHPAAIARLNAYEGDSYSGELHQVTLADGTVLPAWVYLTRPELLQPSAEPWDLDRWRQAHLPAFLAQGQALVDDGPW